MRNLGGWTRLWILLSAVWFLIVCALTTSALIAMGGQIVSLDEFGGDSPFRYFPRLRIIAIGMALWLIPVATAYGLGSGTGWVWRGFTREPS